MNAGGWYLCPESMTGTVFGIYSYNFLSFMESMLYSQEAIQMNALSAVATDFSLGYPATNALQNIVVLLVSVSTQKCVVATAPVAGLAKV